MNKKCVRVYLNVRHSSRVITSYLLFDYTNIHFFFYTAAQTVSLICPIRELETLKHKFSVMVKFETLFLLFSVFCFLIHDRVVDFTNDCLVSLILF